MTVENRSETHEHASMPAYTNLRLLYAQQQFRIRLLPIVCNAIFDCERVLRGKRRSIDWRATNNEK